MTPIQEKVNRLNTLFIEIAEYKADHPDECVDYYDDIGSLLNAYREGDLRWDAAISAIRKACQPQGSDSLRLDALETHQLDLVYLHSIDIWFFRRDNRDSAGYTSARAAIDAAMKPVAAGEAQERGDNEHSG